MELSRINFPVSVSNVSRISVFGIKGFLYTQKDRRHMAELAITAAQWAAVPQVRNAPTLLLYTNTDKAACLPTDRPRAPHLFLGCGSKAIQV